MAGGELGHDVLSSFLNLGVLACLGRTRPVRLGRCLFERAGSPSLTWTMLFILF